MLEELHERLAGVVIECLPFGRLIAAYDRPGTLFYLDPPYWGCEDDYGLGVFGRADFEVMAEQLRGLKGQFLLSLNDLPEVRKTFAGFSIQSVKVTYSLNGAKQNRVGEVLISAKSRP